MSLNYKFFQSKVTFWLISIALIASCSVQKNISSQVIASSIDQVKFKGKILADKDISAIALVGKYILIGADEGNIIQVLAPNKKGTKYKVVNNIELPLIEISETEVDIEGMAVAGNTVYVTGSHVSTSDTKEQNNRQRVFRFRLDSDTGELASYIDQGSLLKILAQDKTLKDFINVDHDKNGIDIEGLAVKDNRLYFGFRTPVLERDYLPVVVVDFAQLDSLDHYELRYVNLEGNGIRDIVAVEEGFLILTDANGRNKNHYRLYFWDGSSDLSKPKNNSGLKFLSKIDAKKDTKAEGLMVMNEEDSSYQILVVFDGVAKGNPTILEIKK